MSTKLVTSLQAFFLLSGLASIGLLDGWNEFIAVFLCFYGYCGASLE